MTRFIIFSPRIGTEIMKNYQEMTEDEKVEYLDSFFPERGWMVNYIHSRFHSFHQREDGSTYSEMSWEQVDELMRYLYANPIG